MFAFKDKCHQVVVVVVSRRVNLLNGILRRVDLLNGYIRKEIKCSAFSLFSHGT